VSNKALNRLKIAMLVLVMALTVGACDSVSQNELCLAHKQVLTGSDGDSGPDIVNVAVGQTLNINYVAIFDSGSAQFIILDSQNTPVWQTDIVKSSNAKSVSVPLKLSAGAYQIIVRTHNATNVTLCWRGSSG
jgi:hypothetical protein